MIKALARITVLIGVVVMLGYLPFTAAHPATPVDFAGLLLAGTFAETDPALTARQSAQFLGLSLPAFWRGVRIGRISKPFYPMPRAPRWRQSWLRLLEETRLLPYEAKEQRRQTRLAREDHLTKPNNAS